MYRHAADGSLLERYGVDIDAIALLGHAMNFSVRFEEPAPGKSTCGMRSAEEEIGLVC